MVEGSRSRFDVINDLLVKFPIESNSAWWLINFPDVYAGYDYAKTKLAPKSLNIKAKTKMSLKLLLIILVSLAVFGVVVAVIMIDFLNQGLAAVLG